MRPKMDHTMRRREPGEVWLTSTLTILSIVTAMSLRARDSTSAGIDWQIMLKIAVWLIAMSAALYFSRTHILKWALNPVVAIWNLAIFAVGISVITSIIPTSSAVYWISMALCMSSASIISYRLSIGRIATSAFFAISIICIGSVTAFLFAPEIGSSDFSSISGTLSSRMSGMVGHPQTMGRIASYGLLLAIFLYFNNRTLLKNPPFLLCVCIVAFCLLMSGSRTPILACVGCIGIYVLWRIPKLAIITFPVLVIGIAIFVSLVDVESAASSLSRTGNVQEILMLNGRGKIWPVVINLIGQKPIFGWGYGTVTSILPQYASSMGFIPGFEPANTQNSVLELMMATGAIGTAFIYTAYAVTIYFAASRRLTLPAMIIVFQLFLGTTEPIPFKDNPRFDLIMLAIAVGMVARGYAGTRQRKIPRQPLSAGQSR
jgi:exopolysaccharide production protein ExoQ